MELEGALEIIHGLNNSLPFTNEKTSEENGVAFLSPSVSSIAWSEASVRKLMSVIRSFIYSSLGADMLSAFYRMSGRRVKPRFLAVGFANSFSYLG